MPSPVPSITSGLLSALRGLWKERTPTRLNRSFNPLYLKPPVSSTLDVDRVLQLVSAAVEGDVSGLFGLYREIETTDSVIGSAVMTRKLAVLNEPMHLVPFDKESPADVQACEFLRKWVDDYEGWLDTLSHLLSASLWPVAVVEKTFRACGSVHRIADLRVVEPELMCFQQRYLRIKRVGTGGEPLTESDLVDPARYIVHRGHLLGAPDHWGGPFRSVLFWHLFGAMDRDWWARFLERSGSPFFVGYYDRNDEESRYNLERAFAEATRLFGIVATNETRLELKEASTTDAGKAFGEFHETAKREKLLAILGQTLSGAAQSTGMGSGVADLQSAVRDDIKKWDALRLGETIRQQLFKQALQINGIPGRPPRPVWGSTDEGAELGGLIKALSDAGLELTDGGINQISERTGLPWQRKAPPPQPVGAGGLPFGLPAAIARHPDGLTPAGMANEVLARLAASRWQPAIGADLSLLWPAIAVGTQAALEAAGRRQPIGSNAAEILAEATLSAAANQAAS